MDDQPGTQTANQFLLLFYRAADAATVSAEEQARRDQEFDDWLRSVETRGELVLGGRFRPDGEARLGPKGEVLEVEPEGGRELARICVIRARDRAGAIETARRAPQVLRGAGAVVRELEPR